MRNTGRRRLTGAAALIAAVVVAGVGGSFGQSSASPAAAEAALPAQSRPAATRHHSTLPHPRSLVSGLVGLSTSARDARAKVNVQVPTLDAAAYIDPAYRTPATQIERVPSYYLPKHPKAGCTYDQAVINADLYAVHVRQPNPKKNGVITSVGRFPDAHVSALGFGSIPVTATLKTRQVTRHGKLLPLTADTTSAFTSLPTQASGEPCDPSWDNGAQTPPLETVSRGLLNVRVSDIRIDKQPLDVGSNCHTVTPMHLNLFGAPGYILYTGGKLIGRADPSTVRRGASVYPLHPGSTNLTIPSFAGCVNPRTGEDVSRLVTAMVSGDRNTIAVHQSSSILNGFSPKHVSKCSSDGKTCVKQPSFLSPPKPGMTVRRHHRH